MRVEYLLFNLCVFFFPFLSSLVTKYKLMHKREMFFSIVYVAVPFVVFDWIVTNYFWSFNPLHTLGVTVVTIPLEEVLFFLTVPFACLYIWQHFSKNLKRESVIPFMLRKGIMFILFGLGCIFVSLGKHYTGIMLLVLAVFFGLRVVVASGLFSKKGLVYLCITLLLTLIFNGYLTGRPIVLYNPAVMTNIRIGSVPIEDFMFGILLIGFCVTVYERRIRSVK